MFRAVFAPSLVALSFLTILPVGVASPTDAEISRSRGWYPAVGLFYGLLLVGIMAVWVLAMQLPPYQPVAAALLVAAMAVVNRFLHLDGLMDYCDAMWGGRTVERRLEIMRDSRVGSFAVAGCASVLLIKFAALSELWVVGSGLGAMLFFPMVSRWTMTLLLTVFPYGRQQGIGSSFAVGRQPWLATGMGLATVMVGAWLLLGPVGIVVLVAVSLASLLLGRWTQRRLGGGLTGDCYGANNEIMEAVALVLLLILLQRAEWAVAVGYGSDILGGLSWRDAVAGGWRAGWATFPGP